MDADRGFKSPGKVKVLRPLFSQADILRLFGGAMGSQLSSPHDPVPSGDALGGLGSFEVHKGVIKPGGGMLHTAFSENCEDDVSLLNCLGFFLGLYSETWDNILDRDVLFSSELSISRGVNVALLMFVFGATVNGSNPNGSVRSSI